ncbi:hypothetical protein HER32_01980 [Hymenobacter sp. BT18]|uniref:hypothetical protein n=1 Tax=Hymenobacter sp. BT18 TaxID=2835648 RepID=UPI00143ECC70|nr:hypothetical protein [Hymenobacter sp. BT18]QIX60023.1 hypothetical protein HER32_01980 [Hymenobacter sp. BT18]
MRNTFYGLLLLGLVGCETRQTATTEARVTPPATVKQSTVVQPAVQPRQDTTDYSEESSWVMGAHAEQLDTLLRIDGKSYRLRMRARSDSSTQLQHIQKPVAGESRQMIDTIRGVDASFTYELYDGQGKRLFQRVLRKPNFYKAAGHDLTINSVLIGPDFVGYNAPVRPCCSAKALYLTALTSARSAS